MTFKTPLQQMDESMNTLQNQGVLNAEPYMTPAPLEYLQSIVNQRRNKALEDQNTKDLAQYGTATPEVSQLLAGQFNPAPQPLATPAPQVQPQVMLPPTPQQVAPLEAQTIEPTPQIEATAPGMKKVLQEGAQAAKQGYLLGQHQAGLQAAQADEQSKLLDAYKQSTDKIMKAKQEGALKAQKADEEASKIQLQDYWADKSTGAKVAAALAMGLGAYAQGMGAGPNTAMAIIDSAIKKDLEMQKEKYQRAKERGAMIRSSYADQVNALGDEQSANLTLLNNYYKNIDTKLKMVETQAKTQEQAMNAQKMRQEIELKKQEIQNARMQGLTQLELSKAVTSGQEINAEALPAEQRERYVRDPQYGGFLADKTRRKDYTEALTQYNNAREMISTLKEIAASPGKSVDPQLINKAQINASMLMGNLKGPIVGPGAISEGEWKILKSVVANPTEFFSLSENSKQRLMELQKRLDINMYNVASTNLTNKPKPLATESNQAFIKVEGYPNVRKLPASQLNDYKKFLESKGLKYEVVGGQ